MVPKQIINQYLKAGKMLTPLKGKLPISKDWTNKQFTPEQLHKHRGNLAWVLGPNDLVIDVDVKNGNGWPSWSKLVDELKAGGFAYDFEPMVDTPSGGCHFYFKLANDQIVDRLRRTLEKDYPHVDFLSKGGKCIIPGSKTNKGRYSWYDDEFGCFSQYPITPQYIVDLLSYKVDTTKKKPSTKWPSNKVKKILATLDPNMPNNEWVKVGMALHDWNESKGLTLWESWSKDGDNYTEGDTAARWKSFEPGHGVTLGTISYMAREVDFDEAATIVDELVVEIKQADEKMLELDLLPRIKKQPFKPLHSEILVRTIQGRLKELSGATIPVGQVRRMTTTPDVADGVFLENGETPDWCSSWVYVNSHTGFMNLDTLHLHKAESFNVENGRHVPEGEQGSKPSASKYIADNGFISKVDSIAYLPTHPERLCDIDGSTVLNSFNPKTVPVEAVEYSDKGLEAVEVVRKHIKFICGNDADSETFTQWLAHQIQFPGRQVLWSPVIQSIQGVGKSFFGELLRVCLGDRNVGTVSPTQVTSDFNGWATGVVVNVLEELRVKGHNRFDAVNALKPLITDRVIQINDKGVKQFMTQNTANYMCFTNYRDALPLNGDDRRWWVVFVPIADLNDLKNYVGEDSKTYFPNLFNAIRTNGPEIRKWLLEYPITDEFMNTKQAPMTSHKLSMIATEEASQEGLIETKELIEKGGDYFNSRCVSSSDLFESLATEHPEIDISNRFKNIILKRLGYSSTPKPVKIDGKARRIWTKETMNNSEIRKQIGCDDDDFL